MPFRGTCNIKVDILADDQQRTKTALHVANLLRFETQAVAHVRRCRPSHRTASATQFAPCCLDVRPYFSMTRTRPPDLTERDVASSNTTLNTFFGSRQKSWMTGVPGTVRPSPRPVPTQRYKPFLRTHQMPLKGG